MHNKRIPIILTLTYVVLVELGYDMCIVARGKGFIISYMELSKKY